MEFTEVPSHVEANKGRLVEILKLTERLIDNAGDNVIVIEKTPDADTLFAAGAAQAENVVESYANEGQEIDLETANAIANIHNQSTLETATITIYHVVARASMQAQMQRSLNGEDLSGEVPPTEELMLSYAKATNRQAAMLLDDGRRVQVEVTHLEGLDQFDSATSCKVAIADDLIEDTVVVGMLGGKVVSVDRLVYPVGDELLRDCITKMPETLSEVTLLLAGQFESEDDLNVALNEIWFAHQNSWNEEEAGPLLDRVRNRALAVRHSAELNFQHGNNVPTTAHLQQVIDAMS